MRVVIVGVGSKIMGDDGFGTYLVEAMSRFCSSSIKFVSLETRGIDLLIHLEGADLGIVVDVAKDIDNHVEVYGVSNDVSAGLDLSSIRELSSMSLHEISPSALAVIARLSCLSLGRVYVILVRSKEVSYFRPMSRDVVSKTPLAIDAIRGVLKRHGISLRCDYAEMLKHMWRYCENFEEVLKDISSANP